jgi:hypothetical protein
LLPCPCRGDGRLGSTADGFSPPADMEILPTETPATAGNAEPSLVQSTESSFISLGRARVRACSPARAEEMVDWDLARGLACRTREQVVVPRSKSKGEQEGLLDKINLAGIILRTEFSSWLAKGGILERLRTSTSTMPAFDAMQERPTDEVEKQVRSNNSTAR